MTLDAGDIVTADDLVDEIAAATLTSNGSAITTTETVVISVTTTLVAGRRYAVELSTKVSASVAATAVILWVRAGSTTSGTELGYSQQYIHSTSSSGWGPVEVRGEFTASVSGAQTFVGTLVRNGGSGNVLVIASGTAPSRLRVTAIRD